MRVSVLNDLDYEAYIFLEDENGIPLNMADTTDFKYNPNTDTPALHYCFFLSSTLTERRDTQRRAVTGRSTRKITQRIGEPTLQVSHYIISKSHDISVISNSQELFSRENRLTIVLREYNPVRGDIQHNESQFILRHAVRDEFSIDSEDSNPLTGSISFQAEELI